MRVFGLPLPHSAVSTAFGLRCPKSAVLPTVCLSLPPAPGGGSPDLWPGKGTVTGRFLFAWEPPRQADIGTHRKSGGAHEGGQMRDGRG